MKKAKLIRRAYEKSETTVIKTVESVKKETLKASVKEPKFNPISSLEEKIKKELIKNNTYSEGNVNYKFELLSYGYVTDTIMCTEKEKAIRYYFTFEDSYDYAYKFYLNGVLMPNKKIKEVLNITYNMQMDFYRSRSRN